MLNTNWTCELVSAFHSAPQGQGGKSTKQTLKYRSIVVAKRGQESVAREQGQSNAKPCFTMFVMLTDRPWASPLAHNSFGQAPCLPDCPLPSPWPVHSPQRLARERGHALPRLNFLNESSARRTRVQSKHFKNVYGPYEPLPSSLDTYLLLNGEYLVIRKDSQSCLGPASLLRTLDHSSWNRQGRGGVFFFSFSLSPLSLPSDNNHNDSMSLAVVSGPDINE